MTLTTVDPRATKDRRCVACGTAITRYSTTGYCGPCSSRYVPRKRRKPTEAQQQRTRAVNAHFNTQKRATPLAGSCVHRWVIPSTPTGPGEYEATCRLCGEVRVHRPFLLEDEAKKKATR